MSRHSFDLKRQTLSYQVLPLPQRGSFVLIRQISGKLLHFISDTGYFINSEIPIAILPYYLIRSAALFVCRATRSGTRLQIGNSPTTCFSGFVDTASYNDWEKFALQGANYDELKSSYLSYTRTTHVRNSTAHLETYLCFRQYYLQTTRFWIDIPLHLGPFEIEVRACWHTLACSIRYTYLEFRYNLSLIHI